MTQARSVPLSSLSRTDGASTPSLAASISLTLGEAIDHAKMPKPVTVPLCVALRIVCLEDHGAEDTAMRASRLPMYLSTALP